jgi:bifunctional non-homologous end joining protein LigD
VTFVAYYLAIAPAILPHFAGRAVTLARYPDGIDGGSRLQTQVDGSAPPTRGVDELSPEIVKPVLRNRSMCSRP